MKNSATSGRSTRTACTADSERVDEGVQVLVADRRQVDKPRAAGTRAGPGRRSAAGSTRSPHARARSAAWPAARPRSQSRCRPPGCPASRGSRSSSPPRASVASARRGWRRPRPDPAAQPLPRRRPRPASRPRWLMPSRRAGSPASSRHRGGQRLGVVRRPGRPRPRTPRRPRAPRTAITGVPAAIASTRVSPKPSCPAVCTSAAAPACSADSCARSGALTHRDPRPGAPAQRPASTSGSAEGPAASR